VRKSIVTLLTVAFLFSASYSVMASGSDSNCPKAKTECPKEKSKKCEDPNKAAGN